MTANINTMMYVGDTPWHGKGTKLNNPATAAEALVAAGLDWKVKKVGLYREDRPGIIQAYATVREDTGDTLGVVKGRFTVLQNKEALSLLDAVVGEKGAIYETAGALGKGEKVWMLAKLPESVDIVKGDTVHNYILLAHAHDGSLKINVLLTPIRVVCQNTLNAALHEGRGENKIALRHTANVGLRITDIREALGLVSANFNVMAEAFQSLAQKQMNQEAFNKLVKKIGLVADNADENTGKIPTRTANMMDELNRMFEAGRGMDIAGVRGTAWGAFNAITEFLDYKTDKKAAESTLFGKGAKIKTEALNELLKV